MPEEVKAYYPCRLPVSQIEALKELPKGERSLFVQSVLAQRLMGREATSPEAQRDLAEAQLGEARAKIARLEGELAAARDQQQLAPEIRARMARLEQWVSAGLALDLGQATAASDAWLLMRCEEVWSDRARLAGATRATGEFGRFGAPGDA